METGNISKKKTARLRAESDPDNQWIQRPKKNAPPEAGIN